MNDGFIDMMLGLSGLIFIVSIIAAVIGGIIMIVGLGQAKPAQPPSAVHDPVGYKKWLETDDTNADKTYGNGCAVVILSIAGIVLAVVLSTVIEGCRPKPKTLWEEIFGYSGPLSDPQSLMLQASVELTRQVP